jgi:exopolysaccharide biosynthesis polyprenyl glycosylphosphotransferase
VQIGDHPSGADHMRSQVAPESGPGALLSPPGLLLGPGLAPDPPAVHGPAGGIDLSDRSLDFLERETGGERALLLREAITRRMLVTADAAAAGLAIFIVTQVLGQSGFRIADLGVMAVIVFVHKLAGLYDRDDLVMRFSTLDELPALVQLSGLWSLLTSTIVAGLLGSPFSPHEVVALWIISFGLIASGRGIARAAARRLAPPERCLVVGDDDRVAHVTEKLARARSRAHVVASVRSEPSGRHGFSLDGMRSVVRRHDVHRLIIATTSTESADTVDLIRMAKSAGVRVSILPRMFEAVGSAVEFEQIDGLMMLGVRRFGLNRSSMTIKRTFDLVAGTILLVWVAPVLTLIAVALKLDSRGPVLFRQKRVGRDGEIFHIWKYRSMVEDAEELKESLRADNEAGWGMFKIAEDPRVTRVGRFLRRTSLDELPQIFNVLKGDMSLVGPRPLVVDEDARIEGLFRSRLHLTPGMTGPWQVLGSRRVPLDEMVAMDYLYVANWSLWTDIKLLLRTVPHVLLHRGL